MSNRSKGNAYELEVKKILERQGWMVERALPKLIWIPGRRVPISTSHDFFGVWDLIGKKMGERTLWIQISVWENIAPRRNKIQALNWTTDHDQMELWGRIGGRNAHYKIMRGEDGFVWRGMVEMVNNKRVSVVKS